MPDDGKGERKSAWRSMLGTAASALGAGVDRAMLAAIDTYASRDREAARGLSHAERLQVLAAVARAYGLAEGADDPGPASRFFPVPSPIDPSFGHRTTWPGRVDVVDARWPTTSRPFLAEVTDMYLAEVANRTAYARLFLGQAGATRRSAVIVVHGFMGGAWLVEESLWPIRWLLARGLDVALPVLPLHAQRASSRRAGLRFPSADPRVTNEGFRQAVSDLAALASYLRARGAPHVGVIGMSLGGYVAALVASVTDAVDFVMPMIPLASIADFARDHGHLGAATEIDEQHAALERANRVVSPLAYAPRVAPGRALVVAAAHDRVTPPAHAARIAAHFGCTRMTVAGSHLLQLGRAEAFRGFAAMLEREGIVEPRKVRSAR